MFGRKKEESHPLIVPAPTKLNETWFLQYERDIFANSDIDQNDTENHEHLRYTLLISARYFAAVPMVRLNAQWALDQVDDYLESPDATPWGVMSLLAGWNETFWNEHVVEISEALERDKSRFIQEAKEAGRYRSPRLDRK